jgi:hypothetical protein
MAAQTLHSTHLLSGLFVQFEHFLRLLIDQFGRLRAFSFLPTLLHGFTSSFTFDCQVSNEIVLGLTGGRVFFGGVFA